MNGLRKIWYWLGDIHLTVVLLLGMMMDLAVGYGRLKTHVYLFHPLNDTGFVKWACTYGKMNLPQTAWLFILIFLMAALAVNTFVCTTRRVVVLCARRKKGKALLRLALKLAPHLMHYAVLVMLAGYLVSYLFSQTLLSNILLPGTALSIPGTDCRVRLDRLDITYYSGNRLDYMQNRAIDAVATLTIRQGRRTQSGRLGLNRPVLCYPYSFHLQRFSPRSKDGFLKATYINLVIKKDPGMKFYFTGMLMFVAGLVMYLYDWFTSFIAGRRKMA